VFIALASAGETRVLRRFNPGERLAFKETTTRQALEELHVLLGATAPIMPAPQQFSGTDRV
jgi:hypothetical protein